jgi:hypothetical protein
MGVLSEKKEARLFKKRSKNFCRLARALKQRAPP